MRRWQDFYRSDECIHKKCDMFCTIMEQAKACIPHAYVEMSANEKPWMTPVLKLLINKRYEAYRKKDYDKYNYYKNKVKKEIAKAKAVWFTKLKESKGGIWKAIRPTSRKSTTGNFKDLMLQFSSVKNIAESLNIVFSSAFTASSIDNSMENRCSSNSMNEWQVDLSVEATAKYLSSLKQGKAAGNDHLSTRLLVAARDVLTGPLTHLFAISISTLQVPVKWKSSNVVLIPKKSNPTLRL